MEKRNYNFLDFLFRFLLTVSIVALVYFVVKSNEVELDDFYILNRKPIIVQADTMEPSIKRGSLVVVKKSKIKDLKDKDVVAYRLDDRIIVHRVFIENGEVRTKADANDRFDFYKITDDNLIGYVSFRLNIPIFKFLDISNPDEGISVDDVEI